MRENLLAYGFLAPSLLLFAVFLFYPMFKSVYLSLHSTDPTGQIAAYVGLDQLQGRVPVRTVYARDESDVTVCSVYRATGMLAALILAALTHNRFKGMRVFQFVFSLPVVLSVGSSAVIWKFLFHRPWAC